MHASLNLKGIAVGNGCWGGDANSVQCNGPNSHKNEVELFFGKGLISSKLHEAIDDACDFSNITAQCEVALRRMSDAVGPYNVYNVYDNCPLDEQGKSELLHWLEHSGKSLRWLQSYLQDNLHGDANSMKWLRELGGGYDWTCGQFDALPLYFKQNDVRRALHLPDEQGSIFHYTSGGPASIVLYPELIQSKLRILIYNGDADSCVPYIGNEEWTSSMTTKGVVTEEAPWHPWHVDGTQIPAGYATVYSHNFTFITIRLAGHQVPQNMPATALAFFGRFLNGGQF